jgi:hypothetical protein
MCFSLAGVLPSFLTPLTGADRPLSRIRARAGLGIRDNGEREKPSREPLHEALCHDASDTKM